VIDSIVAEDCLFLGSTGEVMTKAQADADRRKGILKASTTTQMIVRVFGDVAVVIGANVEQSEYAGQDTSGQYRWTDVFQKRGGQWVVVSAHSTRIDDVPSARAVIPAEKPTADPRLASLEGLSEDQVRARLGSPSLSQSQAQGSLCGITIRLKEPSTCSSIVAEHH
jgi:ketosteroid isomerase-like protein